MIDTVGSPGRFYVYHDTLYVIGYFRTADGEPANSIASWDGEHWHGFDFPQDPLSNAIPFLYTMAFYQGELYAGGNCRFAIDGVLNNDIARYDGTTWKSVGGGCKGGSSVVTSMVVYKDELYVAGQFSSAAGNAGNKIMRWDGDNWHDVGGGVCSSGDWITDLMVWEDKLYVIGIFNCIGGLPASNIAVWDGDRWCNLGNNYFDNKLGCVAVFQDELYVGGGFTTINGEPLKYLAKYVGDHSSDLCGPSVSATAASTATPNLVLTPNPATESVRLSAGAAPLERYVLFDALGQPLRSGAWPDASEQPEINLTGLPPGLYVVQAWQRDGQRWVGRVLKL